MNVLVTGGAGYIGSHTVRRLCDLGHVVVVLDSLEFGRADAVTGVSAVRDLVVGDIRDASLVRRICHEHGITHVVHFAAYKAVGESMQQPGRYWRNNVGGTVELVEAVLAEGVRQFVFSSSCSVNGTPTEVPLRESAPVHPESVYAQTKATVETILGWYGVTHGLRTVNLRYFNAAGASADGRIGEDWRYSQNLVPLVMKAALGRTPELQVYGDDYPTPDGTCIRDYIHVEDLAEAHVMALDHLAAGADGATLNVGTGVGTSVLEVIRATERISGRQVPHRIVARRPGDPASSFADPDLAASVLGWRASRSLDEILSSAWRWHSSTVDR